MRLSVNTLLYGYHLLMGKPLMNALSEDIEIEGVKILPKNKNTLNKSYIYICDKPDDWSDISKIPVCLLCIIPKNDSEIAFHTSKQTLIYYSDEDYLSVFNDLCDVFNTFQNWQTALDISIYKNSEFDEFLNLSKELLNTAILIYDPALKLLSYTKNQDVENDLIFQSAIKNGYLDLDTVKYFDSHHIFEQMDSTGTATGEIDSYRRHADVAKAINVNNELAVYCIMLLNDSLSREYQEYLFSVICKKLEGLLERKHADFAKNRSVSDYFLQDLLDNPETSSEQIQERIYYNDLEFNGNYITVVIKAEKKAKSQEHYFIQLLRNNLIGSRVFSYGDSIIILFNLPSFKDADYKDYLREKFKPFFNVSKGRNIHICFGRPFKSMDLFADSYNQALMTYDISAGENFGNNGIYFFDDCWHKCMISSISKKNPMFYFCEPALLSLINDDSAKAKRQYEVLKEYLLCGGKITNVATKLNMHRNNVIYHIKQIEEKFNYDLEDEELRFKLMLSMEIIKRFA
ncbi:MAG: PucR family transcriptional regulator [Lachnospiraceae bacterium]|nr:PucR family transcriptional regulator [Lachnospiraceae bacterium]